MARPTLLPGAKFVLLGLLVSLLSTSRVLAQAPIVRNELRHELAKPLPEVSVNPPAMPSAIRETDILEMLALMPGFKNIERGGQGRD